MTSEFFPADVSLRVEGNLADAQALFPAARNLLFRALRFKETSGRDLVKLFQPGNDGSLLYVTLAAGMKHLYVQPGPRRRVAQQDELPAVEITESAFFPYEMYSGAVRPLSPETKPKVVMVDDTLVLDQFHPSEVSAAAYALDFAWQSPAKLAINSANAHSTGDARSYFPKPGHYSGSMKRVVQALYGIGWTETDTEGYISEELPPTEPDYATPNLYNFTWLQTHGIYKGPDGGIWLIEVSKDNGVMAMPLPLFKGTDSPLFLNYISEAGDTDTLNVLFEFGGLPTGESFPTGGTLTDALASGKVLRLLTAADVLEFYRDEDYSVNKEGLWAGQGWAFSESGAKADNLTFWYRNVTAIATQDDGAPQNERYKNMQHWRIEFALSTESSEAHPYGSGSATMTKIDESLLIDTTFGHYCAPLLRVPSITAGDSVTIAIIGGYQATGEDPPYDVKASVHVFYVGETLEVVRLLPYPESWYWQVGGFEGDSLSLGDTYTFERGSAGLVIPAGCREGYVLIRADMTSCFALPDGSQARYESYFPIAMKGYFGDVGEVEFTTVQELFSTAINSSLPDAFEFYSWASFWLQAGTSVLITGRSEFALLTRCSATINYGPTGGYVMTDGVLVSENGRPPYVGTGIAEIRPETTTIIQAESIAGYVIPEAVPPSQVTFVGSP